jgi:glycosyltransferase involved in cell wall biosynthesis
MSSVTVVVFAEVKWRYMRTRKRFLLSRFPADWPILYLEPMNRTDESHWTPIREGRVTIATLPVLKAKTTFPAVNALLAARPMRSLLTRWVRGRVERLIARHAPGRPRCFFLSNVLFAPIAARLPRDLIVYDANDDPLGFPGTPPWMGDYLDETVRAADAVVSCSESLAARLRARGARDVTVIGNGVEVEHFAPPVDPARLPAAVRGRARPWIGYAGAVAEWFDFDLVGAVAEAFPRASIVIAGPVAAPVAERAAQLSRIRPNVSFLGRIPYEDLPHLVGAFDVAMIPFRRGPATDVLNPNKLYEYLAAGRTVVTLDYSPDVERLSDSIRIARDPAGFVAAVRSALESPLAPDRLRQRAAGESWDRRAAEFVALIRERLAG